MEKFKVSIVGAGYVGFSLSLLLAQNNKVVVHDIDHEKVDKINNKTSPFQEKEMEDIIKLKTLELVACNEWSAQFLDASFFIIALPTNFDDIQNTFDTFEIEKAIKKLSSLCSNPTIIIKSTVPIGFSAEMQKMHPSTNIIFSPEFLREGQALKDSFYPSRIIIGGFEDDGKVFGELLKQASKIKEVDLIYMTSDEAEAVKLFSNAYLAMRVSFFNELDSLCLNLKLESSNVIKGVSMDSRIGNFYNNPSFGYGGYCLPKDIKQLVKNFKNTPESLISSIHDSNKSRKEFLISTILQRKPKKVGIFRLAMKSNSDNFRESSIKDIIYGLNQEGVEIIIYEPNIQKNHWNEYKVINNFESFQELCDLIIANRYSEILEEVKFKVFTRDIYHVD